MSPVLYESNEIATLGMALFLLFSYNTESLVGSSPSSYEVSMSTFLRERKSCSGVLLEVLGDFYNIFTSKSTPAGRFKFVNTSVVFGVGSIISINRL